MTKKYIFQSEKDVKNEYDVTNVIMTVESDSLEDLLRSFEDFLRANSFILNNVHLDLVED